MAANDPKDWVEVPLQKQPEPNDWVEVPLVFDAASLPKPEKSAVESQLEALGKFGTYTAGSIPVVAPAINRATALTAQIVAPALATHAPYRNAYETVLGEEQARRESYEKEHPTWAIAGNIVSAGFLPGGKQTEIAKDAGKLAKVGNAVKNAVSRYGTTAATVGADATLSGQRDPLESAESALGWQGGLELLVNSVKGAGKLSPRLVTGVKPGTVEKYKARAPQVNAANEENIVRDIVKTHDDLVAKPFDDAVQAERNAARDADVAKDLFIVNRQEKIAAERADSDRQRKLLEDVRNSARDKASRAEMEEVQRLRNTKPDENLPTSITQALKEARKAVSNASSEGFDALKNSNELVNIVPWKSHLTGRMNELKINGQVPPSRAEDYAALKQWREYLDKLGEHELRPEDAKRFIQALDAAEEKAYSEAARAGGYVNSGDRALMDLRRMISDDLKQNYSGYAAAMSKASTSERMIGKVRDLLGNDERAISKKLGNLDPYQRQVVSDIGFDKNLEPYEQAKSLLLNKPALDDHLSRLPERGALKDAESKLQSFEPNITAPLNRIELKSAINNLPETQARNNAEMDVALRKAWMSPVSGLGNVGNAQSALRRSSSEIRPDIKSKDALQYLDDLSGKNFSQQADDLAVQRAFTQGFTRGSRNVNLAGMSLSGALGTASKMMGGSSEIGRNAGSTIGAVLGAASDLVGPQVYKKWLDLSMDPRFQKYAKILNDAARRGPQAVAVTHYLMTRNDPTYRSIVSNEGVNQQ